MEQRTYAVKVSTEIFHLLQDRRPGLVAWQEEKAGPTQKVLLEDDVYTALIDRAIDQRKTLDVVFRELCFEATEAEVADPTRFSTAQRTE